MQLGQLFAVADPSLPQPSPEHSQHCEEVGRLDVEAVVVVVIVVVIIVVLVVVGNVAVTVVDGGCVVVVVTDVQKK